MGIKVISCFDGMGCGMLAMMASGVKVDRYVAYEIDKYAVKTATHNFPQIEECGDVFKADFNQYQGFDFLVGGSPCTYWSIAQKNNRETEASGLGWELFSQYVRALKEAKPRYFIYENNKSMSKAIRDSIRDTFGFEEICINSALVSAQNRQRYYWVGKYNPETGWYDKVPVEQPEDRGILLKDVLDGHLPVNATADGKAGTLRATCYKDGIRNMVANDVDRKACVAEPIATTTDGKSYCLVSSYHKGFGADPIDYNKHHQQRSAIAEPVRVGTLPREDGTVSESKQYRIYSEGGKATTQCAEGGGMGAKTGLYAVPVPTSIACRGRDDSSRWECRDDGVSGAVRAEYRSRVAEPVAGRVVGRRINAEGHRDDCNTDLEHIQRYEVNGNPQKTNCVTTVSKDNMIAQPVPMAVDLQVEGRRANDDGTYTRVWEAKDNQKSSALTTVESRRMVAEPTPQYAIPCEWDSNGIPTKAVSGADGKTYTVYRVENGLITIKGKTYPIKLVDGYYIIRKLTVSECKRLQTVPEWYDFSCVSNTQAYKMLGNGWTVEVISHLIDACLRA